MSSLLGSIAAAAWRDYVDRRRAQAQAAQQPVSQPQPAPQYPSFGSEPAPAYEPIDYGAGLSPYEPPVRVPRVQPYQWQAPAMPQWNDFQQWQPWPTNTNWTRGWG